MDGKRTKCRGNIAENYNRLSRVHERYRRQTDRQTHGRPRQHVADVNVSSRLVKSLFSLQVTDGKKMTRMSLEFRYQNYYIKTVKGCRSGYYCQK